MTRSIQIKAPAAQLFEQVNDLHKMNAWSPWMKLDPNVKGAYEGPESGIQSSYSWAGNKDVGAGKMTITESRPYELVRVKLEFLKPFVSEGETEFTLKEANGETTVTQTMRGKKIFLSKVFTLFCSMDKVIGGQFEKGLATMKSLVEQRS